jgi:PPM family protein phosphatase
MVCADCSTDVPDEDLFCENCGSRLPQSDGALERCVCGAPLAEADEDGFCQGCGRRVRRPASDHVEEALSPGFAAVSDRGLRHERNEDRFALVQEGDAFAVVVCDGVSATNHPEVASEAVAQSVADTLRQALRAGDERSGEELLRTAFAAGAEALRDGSAGSGEDAASTTAVCALVRGGEITVAWVGDSRAYWLDERGAQPLTRDHSWMNLALDLGEMTHEEIEAAPQAHAITRWIGPDAEDAALPEVVRHAVEGSGALLLCTDGLWNYLQDPTEIAARVAEQDGGDAIAVARALVGFANEQGGRDNITVALLRVEQTPELAVARAADEVAVEDGI